MFIMLPNSPYHPWDRYIYLLIYHKNQPSHGSVNIKSSYIDLMDYKVVVNHIYIYCPIGSNPNGVISLLVATLSNQGWLQTSHIATYPSIIFKLWPVNLPPPPKSYPPLVSLLMARCSTPHFLARGGEGETIYWPSVHRKAGSDGRLAGHFTKLAELQRPARTWEDGQTPVENGG